MNLNRCGIHADLPPRDGFIGSGPRVRSIKLLSSVDKHSEIRSISLREINKKKKVSNILLTTATFCFFRWGGSSDYHEISISDMMFNKTSSENDHSCALGKHGFAVQPSNICKGQKHQDIITTALKQAFVPNPEKLTLHDIKHQPGVLVRVEVDHIAQ